MALKEALPACQLLVSGERRIPPAEGVGHGDGIKEVDGFLAMKAGADACVVGASNPCEFMYTVVCVFTVYGNSFPSFPSPRE